MGIGEKNSKGLEFTEFTSRKESRCFKVTDLPTGIP